MADKTTVGDVVGGVDINNAEKINQAENDIVERDKITNITNNYYLSSDNLKTEEKTKQAIQGDELLPYLTNRKEQELKIGRKIITHKLIHSPLVCIIHGKEEDCSDTFIKRLYRQSLRTIIPEQIQQGIQCHYIGCDHFVSEDDFHEKMLASLSNKVVKKLFAAPEDIAQVIAQQNCPVLLWTTLASDKKGVQGIEFFLKFWQKWPQLPEKQKHLLLVCLSFKYKEEKEGLFAFFSKNKASDKIRAYLENLEKNNFANLQLNGVVLPELNEIEQSEVENWAKDYLIVFYEKLQPKIQQLFKKQEKIAMQPLAEKLEEILDELA